MKKYLVGGAVRDFLLGLKPKDFDFVVVDASEADFPKDKFKLVGNSFPVYQELATGHEYAFARKERKTGNNYADFSFDLNATLIDDLKRRDLTINSIALDLETGELIDPFNGIRDLDKKVLRHTSSRFEEDPLRVLRMCRFFSKYNFSIDHETLKMCKKMVADRQLDNVHFFRLLGEFKRSKCSKFIQLLKIFGGMYILNLPNDLKNESNDYLDFLLNLSEKDFESFNDKFPIEKSIGKTYRLVKSAKFERKEDILKLFRQSKAYSTDKFIVKVLEFHGRLDLLCVLEKLKNIKYTGSSQGPAVLEELKKERLKIMEDI